MDENKTSVHGDGSTTVKSPLVDATGADIGNTVTRLGDLSLSRDSSTGSNVSGISGVSVSCASSNGGDAGVDGTEGKEFEKMASEKDYSYDVRVAVVGNVDSGKSTLIGVLTLGDLDDGRGGARSKVVVHRHEAESGRTSCVSQHIMGFNEEKEAVHQSVLASASSAAKTKGWSEVVSKSKSLITFIDLAGHEKYLKTTIAGLTGCFPDYAVVLVNSLAGVTKMTREHLGVVIALKIPLSVVVTKIDLCPQNVLKRTKKQLFRILRSKAAKKIPIIVKGQEDIQTALDDPIHRVTPVFWVSSVTGKNIDSLTSYLSQLMPRTNYDAVRNKPIEFRVEETFNVTGVGTVISGTVASGKCMYLRM